MMVTTITDRERQGTAGCSLDDVSAVCRTLIADSNSYDINGNLIAEADVAGTITRYYVYGLGLLSMIVPEIPADTVYTYHFNGIGSTVAMTDQTETIVNSYAYTPFGIVTNESETITQPFKYVGEYGVMHEQNGFYYMRARYYDPNAGRFVSEDPIKFAGGTVNLYEYVGNDPVRFIDPSGTFLTAIANPYVIGGVVIVAAVVVHQYQHDPNFKDAVDNLLSNNDPYNQDDLIESVQVPSTPLSAPDFSNGPEFCRLQYEACKKAVDVTSETCGPIRKGLKKSKCVVGFLGCLLSNLGDPGGS